MDNWEKRFLRRRKSQCKGPEVGSIACWRSRKVAAVTGSERAGEERAVGDEDRDTLSGQIMGNLVGYRADFNIC